MGILDTFKRKKSDEPAADKAKAPANRKPAAKKAAKPAAAVKPASDVKELAMSGILAAPAMTEKSFRLQADGKYVFYVNHGVNKHQVKMAVKETYGTEPVAVHMMNRKPQTLYRWGRETGVRKAVKKAIVTMPKGTTLPLTTNK